MTAVFFIWMIVKSIRQNDYKAWVDFHPFKIMLVLLTTTIFDWYLIVKGLIHIFTQ